MLRGAASAQSGGGRRVPVNPDHAQPAANPAPWQQRQQMAGSGSRTASEPQKGGPEYSGPPFVRQRVDRGAELLRLSEVDGDGLAVVPPTR